MTLEQTRDEDRMDRLVTYGVLCFMPLFFSSNIVIGRSAAELVPPSSLAFWRWLIAFLILLPFAWRGLQQSRHDLWSERWSVLLLAILGMVICGAGVYVGLKYTTATNAALIYTATPVVILLFEWLFSGVRLRALQVAGVVGALSGVLVIIFKGDPARLLAVTLNFGDLCMAFAAVAWAGYSIILKRPVLKALPTITVMAAVIFCGAVFLAPLALWEFLDGGGVPAVPRAWISIVSVAFFASVMAFSTYQHGIRKVGPGTTSVFMYLIPLYSALLASTFLGETIATYHLVGAGLIVGGVILATRLARH